jgi:sulfur-oxidizing protein SoxZ
MADPMRIRATIQGDVVDFRVLVSHEMETGHRKDPSGKTIPAHFIQEIVVRHNGTPVMRAQWGTAVSKNPFLAFKFKGGQKGDKVSVTWTDNKGQTRTDEGVIG